MEGKSSFDDEKITPVKKGKMKGLPFKVILIFLGVIGIGVGIYFYTQYEKSQKLLKDPAMAVKLEQQSLIQKIAKLVDLPKDEEPTVATVSDVTKLKDKQFFAKAQNGFKVLIYPKNKKAVLYDPASNKVVEMGPINIDEQAQGPSPVSSPAVSTSLDKVNVALYNGTKNAGLAGTVEKDLEAKASNVTVVSKANAKGTYSKTLVVDLTGKQKEVASQLAKLLNGEVGVFPKGEIRASSSAEILIILGR